MVDVNAVRGEIEVRVGPVTLVMAVDMDGLAKLSSALGNPPFPDLYQKLVGTEIVTTRLALRLFAVRGERDGKSLDAGDAGAAAAEAFRIDDMGPLQEALRRLVATCMRKDDKGTPAKKA